MTNIITRFRWVACQIDRLGKLPHDTARRKALQDLPPDLDSTYERILSSINENDEFSRVLVQNTLRWIILAKEPLRTEQLCEALAIEDGSTILDREGLPDEEIILDLCSSLIRKSVNGDRLELSHFTVKEYLMSPRISSNGPLAAYHVDPAAATLQLSKKCMTYLNLDDFRQNLPETEEAWRDRHNTYSFRVHAIKFWRRYATEDADHFRNEGLFSLCQKLFDPDESLNFLSYAQDSHKNAHSCMNIFSLPMTGETPLHYAAVHHLVRLQQWLLSRGCNVNHVGSLGSPLQCALFGSDVLQFDTNYLFRRKVSSEQIKSISLLLHAGGDWSIPLRDSQNRLRSILVTLLTCGGMEKEGKVSLLKAFLDAGAMLNRKDIEELEIYYQRNKDEYGTIFKVVQRHHIQEASIGRVLDLALKMESSGHFRRSEIKYNPKNKLESINRNEAAVRLRWAARFDQTDKMSRLLRNRELDINSATADSANTALHIALSNGSIGAVKLLLDAGADVNQPDYRGYTALHKYAYSDINEPSIGALLVRRGGIIGRTNMYGKTLLDVAAIRNNVDQLRTLLALNEQEEGTLFAPACTISALRETMNYGCNDATKLLIDNVEDVNYRFAGGTTLAHYCWRCSAETCHLLIEKGLDVDAVTDEGESALHCFISGGSEPAVIQLLATPATINLPDSNGMTPAARLCSRSWVPTLSRAFEMMKELVRHGADFTRIDSSGRTPLDSLTFQYGSSIRSTCIGVIIQHAPNFDIIVREDFWRKELTWALANKNWNLVSGIGRYCATNCDVTSG